SLFELLYRAAFRKSDGCSNRSTNRSKPVAESEQTALRGLPRPQLDWPPYAVREFRFHARHARDPPPSPATRPSSVREIPAAQLRKTIAQFAIRLHRHRRERSRPDARPDVDSADRELD